MNNPNKLRNLFIIISIALAVIAQSILPQQEAIAIGIVLFLAAIALMLIATPDDGTPTSDAPATSSPPIHLSVWRWLALLACIVCAILAFQLNADDSFVVDFAPEYQFTFPGIIAWFASIVFFFIAFWEPAKNRNEWCEWFAAKRTSLQNGIHLNWKIIALVALLILGAFFYFYRIDNVPAEMTSDHAEKLLDVNDILSGKFPLFFNRNTGREPLQFYVTALLMQLTGIPLSHLALKFGTALIGFLTIPATYLLAREMFDDTVAWLAGFFIAVMHWATAIARMGLRYPYTPFFAALSLWFVFRAMKTGKRNDFLMAGLTLGAGLYGYIPSRNVPLVALGLFALWAIFEARMHQQDWRRLTLNLMLMLACIVIVFVPLLRFSLDQPEMFWYRALTRVSSAEQPIQDNIGVIFIYNLRNLALMFNWRGDEVWVTNVADGPTLDIVSGGLFVLGVVIAAYRLLRPRGTRYLYLLAAFSVLLLHSALAFAFPRENPSLVRTGGAIPFAAILLALPLALVLKLSLGKKLRYVIVGLLLLTVVVLNYRWYFIDYAENYKRSAQNSTEVAAVIRDFAGSVGDLQHAYFIGYPFWIDGRAIAINLGDITWHNYTLAVSDFIDHDNSANQLFILHPSDRPNMNQLTVHYPDAQAHYFHSQTPGKDFIVVFVPASQHQ